MEMVGNLKNLHPPAVVASGSEFHPRLFKPFDVFRVDFKPVPVPLTDICLPVYFVRLCILIDNNRDLAEAHRPAHLLYFLLPRQDVDNRMRRIFVKFDTIRILESEDVPGKLNRRKLEPEAYPEIWDVVLPRVSDCSDLAFGTPPSKSARNENPVHRGEVFHKTLPGRWTRPTLC